MDEYEVGYGKPPRATRFMPGTSGNPKGRPKRRPSQLGDIVNDVLDAPIRYHENGHARTASRREVALKLLVQRATRGDVWAADLVHRNLIFARRRAGAGSSQLLVCDWLPDYPGQTAAEKARDLGSAIGSQVAAAMNASSPHGEQPEAAGVTEAVRETAK
jgi:hypothetical protein